MPGGTTPFNSVGAENLISLLSPNGPIGRRTFPPEWSKIGTRIGDFEPLQQWFKKTIDSLNGEVGRCTIEENVACFFDVSWAEGNTISQASLQALIVLDGHNLEDYYCDESGSLQVQYLRLNYDRISLGHPFTHSLPHIHVHPKESPRFPLELCETGNIVLDFMDFVFRNFFHDDWLQWARSVCRTVMLDHNGDDIYPIIELAFKAGKFGELVSTHYHTLNKMKQALRQWKDERFALRSNKSEYDIINYWA